MKMRSFKYLIREGFANAWANRLMSLASIGVLVACMVVIGLAVMISENVNKAMGRLEQQNVVMVYMKDYSWALYGDNTDNSASSAPADGQAVQDNADNGEQADENGIKASDYIIHDEKEARALCAEIEKLPNVKSAEYISGDAGLESVKANMLEGQEQYFSFLNDKYGNPLSAAAKVTMEDMTKFDDTVNQIKKINGVDTIQSQGDLADKISAIKKGVTIAGFWIIAILMVISLVIVSNTIRVTMYNRKLEISIMKAVGATDAFVRIPFVVEGMLIGLISALISEGLLYVCYRIASEAISKALGTADLVLYKDVAWYLLLIFVGIGVFAGVLGSVIMISKYLRKEGSEFAAI